MSLTPILVILSKDLTEQSDTGRVAGVRSFAALRTTGKRVPFNTRKLTRTLVILNAAKDLADRSDTARVAGVRSFAALRTTGKKVLFSTRELTHLGAV